MSMLILCFRKVEKLMELKENLKNFSENFAIQIQQKVGAKKEPSWTKREKLLEIRKDWEDILNQRLEEKGIEKVSCKSLKEQKKKR